PKSLTLWIALSDATPENGCMYLVPADRYPTYNTPEDAKLRFTLPDIRVLPAPAGTAFAWTQAIFHWGARSSSRAAGPRISVGFEFQRGDIAPFNQPLLDIAAPPPFAGRLKLIAKQLLQYDHNYPLPEGQRALARGVLGIAA
ncbi:MAG: phytanoyl-CoA dioxygenase family protein, partial [Chloroflexi bacterium]|nr:phytanoyl-CoA dioxygenase family protein [Chloroflexota bacterium]